MVLYSLLVGVYSLQIFVDCYFSILVILTAGQMPQNFFFFFQIFVDFLSGAPSSNFFLNHGELYALLYL